MSLRSGTQKYGFPKDKWITEGGYTRNLAIEQKLESDNEVIQQYNQDFKGGLNPTTIRELPSWWNIVQHEFGAPYANGYQQQHWTKQEALEFCNLVVKIVTIKKDLNEYRCNNYPRDPNYCSYISGNSSTIGQFLEYGKQLEKEINTNTPPHPQQLAGYPQYYKDIGYLDEQENIITGLPQWQYTEIIPPGGWYAQVFAEDDPSINSGLNGYEDPQVVNYPQSANVRIVISNISMFSTSIPINDIGQLQVLSNASNEWRYTLIGHGSTNPPLMTLSGLINKINSMIASAVVTQPPVIEPPVIEPPVIEPPVIEPPVITTVHIPPPDMPVEEPPMVTATEPGQVNWIPEPFFSFINNVFRKNND